MSEDYYPGSVYQRLFNAIVDTGVAPLDSELQDIIRIVHEDFPASAASSSLEWVDANKFLPMTAGKCVCVRYRGNYYNGVRNNDSVRPGIDIYFPNSKVSTRDCEWLEYSPSPALPLEPLPSIIDKLKEVIRTNGSQTDIHRAAKTVKDYLTGCD